MLILITGKATTQILHFKGLSASKFDKFTAITPTNLSFYFQNSFEKCSLQKQRGNLDHQILPRVSLICVSRFKMLPGAICHYDCRYQVIFFVR